MTTSAEKRITNTLDLIEALEEERDHIDSQVEDLKRESKELDRVIMVHCEKLRELRERKLERMWAFLPIR